MSDTRTARTRAYAERRVWPIARRVLLGVYSDGFIHAGNIAYLSMLALFPFFIIVTALAQLFGQSGEGAAAIEQMLHLMPRSIRDMLRPIVSAVLAARTGPLLWLGAAVGLWTVGSFVETIRDILRRAYATGYTAAFWKYRLWSGLTILAAVLAMFVAFAVQAALTAAENVIDRFFPVAQELVGWIGLSRVLPGFVLFGALYILFLTLTPSRYRLNGSPRWPGALLTACWWLATTAVLPLVLGRLNYGLTYGSLASVIVTLFFFWLVGLGLVTGAHLNAALARPIETGVRDGAG